MPPACDGLRAGLLGDGARPGRYPAGRDGTGARTRRDGGAGLGPLHERRELPVPKTHAGQPWHHNVDHCARLCHASSVTGLGMAFGSGAMTNPIRDIRDADCILITGSNTAESHPVISYEVVRAVKRGAQLIIIDPRRVPLVDHATLFLQPTPGTDSWIFLAMAHVILREGWADTAFIETRTEGFEAFAHSVEPYTPQVAALASCRRSTSSRRRGTMRWASGPMALLPRP